MFLLSKEITSVSGLTYEISFFLRVYSCFYLCLSIFPFTVWDTPMSFGLNKNSSSANSGTSAGEAVDVAAILARKKVLTLFLFIFLVFVCILVFSLYASM